MQPDTFLLDVRPQDYSKGPEFIKGAYHCPLLNLTDRIDDLPKDKRIIISDWKMQQSPLAAKYLIGQDFTVIGVLRGGMTRWISEKLPFRTRSIKTETLSDELTNQNSTIPQAMLQHKREASLSDYQYPPDYLESSY